MTMEASRSKSAKSGVDLPSNPNISGGEAHQMSARLNELSKVLQSLEARVAALEQDKGALVGRVDALEKDNTGLKTRINTLAQAKTALAGRIVVEDEERSWKSSNRYVHDGQ